MFQKSYFDALKDISLDVRSGDCIGVIGKNGAGKSTLLRILAGIIKPQKGQLKVAKDTKLALMTSKASFHTELSGRDNIFLSGLLMGFSKKFIQSKLNEIIEFSELQEHIDVPVRTYSSGMKARLGFSLAYYLEADVILIDEVLSTGDAAFKKKSLAAMKEKIANQNTVIIVSHNLEILKEVCTHVFWIEDGINKAFGAPGSILDKYKSLYE